MTDNEEKARDIVRLAGYFVDGVKTYNPKRMIRDFAAALDEAEARGLSRGLREKGQSHD